MTTVAALTTTRTVTVDQAVVDGREVVWITVESPNTADFTITSIARVDWDALVAGIA